MQQPIGQSGRVRLSPLMSAVASSKSPVGVDPNATRGSTSGGAVRKAAATVLPAGVDPEAVEVAQQKAAQGDQEAIDWLKAAGIAVGAATVAGGAYAIKRALSNRNKKTLPPNFGAEDVATKAQTPNTATAVSKHSPQVTRLRDEQYIPIQEGLPLTPEQRLLTNKAGPLPSPDILRALAAPGPNYPIGPTRRQMDEDAAYAINDIEKAKPKNATKAAIAARKASRMAAAAAALRKIR